MKLFFCEKPSQAADIASHVGAVRRCDGFFEGMVGNERVVVTFAVGHLLELVYPDAYRPELKQWTLVSLPFIPTHGAWQMGVKSNTAKQFAVVKALLKQAKHVVIATDADREGEVIAREVMSYCNYRGSVERLWLTALDDASIQKALSKPLPGSHTIGMAYAGMGRARADWAMGLNLTRALTVAFGGGQTGVLNCGRVQTPTMALVVRRERCIQSFKRMPYYDIDAIFEVAKVSVVMRWQMSVAIKSQYSPFEGSLDADGRLIRRDVAEGVVKQISTSVGKVTDVIQTDQQQAAPNLYSLSTLQIDCSKRFGMTPAKTLNIVQSLYEIHKATTYPRSDCEFLPESMAKEVPAVLNALNSMLDLAACNNELPALLRQSMQHYATMNLAATTQLRVFNDSKITAHHAIIPTLKQGVQVSSMTTDERQVYDLIVRRYLAQWLGAYEYQQTDITVVCAGELFKARGAVIKSFGWKYCYPQPVKPSTPVKTPSRDVSSENTISDNCIQDTEAALLTLPVVYAGDSARNKSASVRDCLTKPPQRYTEGTLLAAMDAIDKEISDPRFKAVMKNKEKAGIGTDATRAKIIENLFENGFLERCPTAKKSLSPTSKAYQYIDLLEQVVPSVLDPVLTAMWEKLLSQVQASVISLEQFEHTVSAWVIKLVEEIKIKSAQGLRVAPESSAKASVPMVLGSSKRIQYPAKTKPQVRNKFEAKGVTVDSKDTDPCPKCLNAKLSLVASTKYVGRHVWCCANRACGYYEWVQ
jgi:DNA topoisomerase III